jgi:hypothetical protein
MRRNIPFVKFGGLKFLEAAHIKDVLGFLRATGWRCRCHEATDGFQSICSLGDAVQKTRCRGRTYSG